MYKRFDDISALIEELLQNYFPMVTSTSEYFSFHQSVPVQM